MIIINYFNIFLENILKFGNSDFACNTLGYIQKISGRKTVPKWVIDKVEEHIKMEPELQKKYLRFMLSKNFHFTNIHKSICTLFPP